MDAQAQSAIGRQPENRFHGEFQWFRRRQVAHVQCNGGFRVFRHVVILKP
ncbi:hypothetical protein ACFOEY_11405 [Paracandidimonas soli]